MPQFKTILCLVICLLGANAVASTQDSLQKDLNKILQHAQLPLDAVQFHLNAVNQAKENIIEVRCLKAPAVGLVIAADPKELVSTFYYGLHRLGFLFPHPRQQISPEAASLRQMCGQKFVWRPTIAKRGFHLHTQHPNEWVHGFFRGQAGIANDLIYWLARNQQNLLQIQMLRPRGEPFPASLRGPLALAKDLQIERGLSVSLSMMQQKSYPLLPLWRALTGLGALNALHTAINQLEQNYDFDFLTVELGTTEFTPLGYSNTLRWLNELSRRLQGSNKYLMTKIHVSTNQYSESLGNYNFLPDKADASVGALPHTVMYYGLLDTDSPVYGRKNFQDMTAFMLRENSKRRTWYYPETSYFIGMDIDVPLFLTDYLRTRTKDFKYIVDNKIAGHINFSTGQELGYWLMDWQVALQANTDYLGDELAALTLLKEKPQVWQNILNFQTDFIKMPGLLPILSTSNLFDELPLGERIHERNLINELYKKPTHLIDEIQKLESALSHMPAQYDVQNPEIKIMLQVMNLRIQHATYLRKAIRDHENLPQKSNWINHARRTRESAKSLLAALPKSYNRYPDAQIFEIQNNPTSYQFGYGYPAVQLYYWEREQKIIENRIKNPLFMNLYDPIKILF